MLGQHENEKTLLEGKLQKCNTSMKQLQQDHDLLQSKLNTIQAQHSKTQQACKMLEEDKSRLEQILFGEWVVTL